jgi:hypothetical protein
MIKKTKDFIFSWLGLGVISSVLYSAFSFYILWPNLTYLFHFNLTDLNKIGGYLAGVFSPLAFIWFMFSYLKQNKLIEMEFEKQNKSVRSKQPKLIVTQCDSYQMASRLKGIRIHIMNIKQEAFNLKIINQNDPTQVYSLPSYPVKQNQTIRINTLLTFEDLSPEKVKRIKLNAPFFEDLGARHEVFEGFYLEHEDLNGSVGRQKIEIKLFIADNPEKNQEIFPSATLSEEITY